MQVSSTALRKEAGDFMNWWLGELSVVVPQRVQQALKPASRTIAVFVDGDKISLERIEAGAAEQIGSFTFGDDKFGMPSSDLSRIVAAYPAARWRWGLYLGNDVVLKDVLRLPSAARENYFEAVEFQLDRQTPFQRTEVYFDCRPVASLSGSESFAVEYVVAPRPPIDAVIRRLTAMGVPLDFATAISDRRANQPLFNLLPDHDLPHRNRSHRLTTVLAALVVLLGCSAVYLSLDNDRRHAAALGLQVEELKKEARATALLRDALATEDRNINAVLDLKRDHTSVSQVLNDLSALLPDDTWVSRFSYNGGKAQIVVHAPESASVVGLIEGSEQFVGAKMMTAVRRLKNENRERFTLGFSSRKGGKH
jgi:general secretion pathway protein L